MLDYEVSTEGSPVREAVAHLTATSRFLRLTGLLAAILTIGLGAGIVLAMARLLLVSPRALVAWAVGLAFGNIILVILHETQKRKGDALFEEISDELQWHLARSTREAPTAKSDRPKPDLEARIALREYLKATDLPLIPGGIGPALYVGSNFAAVAVFISTMYRYLS